MEKYPSRKILSIFNLVFFVGTIIVNSLAMSIPINNKTTGELSDQYPNLFVPAGSTFSSGESSICFWRFLPSTSWSMHSGPMTKTDFYRKNRFVFYSFFFDEHELDICLAL